MSSSEPNLRWYQPGVLGIPHRLDAIASATMLVGRGCMSAPDPTPGTMSSISVYRTSLRQTYGSNRLSRSGSETGSGAILNQHGWLQNAELRPSSSYQLLPLVRPDSAVPRPLEGAPRLGSGQGSCLPAPALYQGSSMARSLSMDDARHRPCSGDRGGKGRGSVTPGHTEQA
ncbi:uncharacterized protein J5F26_002596 isoform 1-T4 [Ciconia maguari]